MMMLYKLVCPVLLLWAVVPSCWVEAFHSQSVTRKTALDVVLSYQRGLATENITAEAAPQGLLPRTSERSSTTSTTSSSVFRPWPFGKKATANGDYAQDLYLEQHIGGTLYSRQTELPNLPIPSLQDTLQRLIPTVLPLAQDETETQEFLQACQDFTHQAAHLQQRLQDHNAAANTRATNWVQGWWQKQAYLQYRNPLPHYVSYYLMIPDDNSLIPKGEDAALFRGAAILHAAAESRKLICSGTMPPDTTAGNAPLCSVGFKYMFHASRIPKEKQDIYHLYDPARYRHAIVAIRGQFYAIDIVDNDNTQDPLPLPVLLARLRRCRDMAADDDHHTLPQLGWCTSLHRDEWTQCRNQLLQQSPLMAQALESIESAAFVLNLDDEEPETFSQRALQFWQGGSQAGNRWFDKPMQILVTPDGHAAYQGEHSMVDAAPVISVIQRILKKTYSRLAKRTEDSTIRKEEECEGGVSNVFERCWKDPILLEKATAIAKRAREHHRELSAEFELDTAYFDGFGKKKAKQWGYDGPLVAQLAIQLAGYRLFGKLVATYEAASTRCFRHGRTEATRPVQPETKAFVKTMANEEASRDEKLSALQAAASAIAIYQQAASNGQGVDRHLFGLCSVVKEGEAAPKLFSNPLFQKSKAFRLSTSSVVFLPGFGPVEDDGLGVAFNAEKDCFLYTVTSRKENKYTRPFCRLLEEALHEIGDLLDETTHTGS
ncbi:Carnitine O-palmitoyltransferase 1, muscle isoform [Seminavis robusta]|uniref:Carnitine O-palmitoyltransferase 1, muscle isoform n=1 Tax=Seminavis robusta TaxID=568900 RepID=A0A9N8DDP2_9STRA|nr:Carnitine O-palmitoyltransferase 1, muscle isoform [Seminavis robusta]|eukprot:Sro46_g027320.1 Carnitine O-palmitoyltransferase 1, muscle isoform (716) ;mRNA; f:19899-22269